MPVGHRDVNVWPLAAGLVGTGFLHDWCHWEEAKLWAWWSSVTPPGLPAPPHQPPPLCLQAGGQGAAGAQGRGRGHHGGCMELPAPGCSSKYLPVFSTGDSSSVGFVSSSV